MKTNVKKYKLLIRRFDMNKLEYITEERIVITNDIYHEIGKIYCTTIEKIKRIDYCEIKQNK